MSTVIAFTGRRREPERRDVTASLYPEMAAGGFSRVDPRVNFYTRVNALLRPDMTVVDLGAGRGCWADILSGYRRSLVNLKGKCRWVIGIDPDPAVLRNPMVDEALVVAPGEALPLPDRSVDLIVAYAVLEHVEDPAQLAGEIRRVLRPGGWFCAWTPNKWGYVGVGARLVPSSLHARLLPVLSPHDRRQAEDVFPTFYRMNTLRQIQALFPVSDFENCSYLTDGPPSYNLGSSAVARLIQLYGRLAPPGFAQLLHVFVRRR